MAPERLKFFSPPKELRRLAESTPPPLPCVKEHPPRHGLTDLCCFGASSRHRLLQIRPLRRIPSSQSHSGWSPPRPPRRSPLHRAAAPMLLPLFPMSNERARRPQCPRLGHLCFGPAAPLCRARPSAPSWPPLPRPLGPISGNVAFVRIRSSTLGSSSWLHPYVFFMDSFFFLAGFQV